MLAETFWQDELKDFPRPDGACRLWIARCREARNGGGLAILHSVILPTDAEPPFPSERPPLTNLYRCALDGAPRSLPLAADGGGPQRLLVEPVRGETCVVGLCALRHPEDPVWNDTLAHWLARLGRRLRSHLPFLPADVVAPLRASGPPTLFPLPVPIHAARRTIRETPVGYPLPPPAMLPDVPGVVGVSREMRECCRSLRAVAASGVNVLLHGESGTGKEVLAKAVHGCSPRREMAFVGLNCAALPESLFESELFGHKAGAFTGAAKEKRGLLEAADGGTFFLDEIGDMPLLLQIKLLRVMQERRLRRIGELKSRPVDVRFVSASHKDLEGEIDAGRFRLDLYYRLKVVRLGIPALRHRPEDIPHLMGYFLLRHGRSLDGLIVAGDVLEAMQRYRWPGNVRELENEVSRWCALHPEGRFMQLDDLSLELRKAGGRSVDPADLGTLRPMAEANRILEHYLIRKAVDACRGCKTDAARRLGLSRQGLYKKIKRYGLEDLLQIRT